jgi:hypothetical protein
MKAKKKTAVRKKQEKKAVIAEIPQTGISEMKAEVERIFSLQMLPEIFLSKA